MNIDLRKEKSLNHLNLLCSLKFTLNRSSFPPSAIREWNKLPIEHRNAELQDMFKVLITNTKNKVPCYFYSGNRIEQMLQTQLRTECSSLNFFLHRRYLVPSLNCVCGAIENNKRYLLDFYRYVNARDEMLNILLDIQTSQLTFYCSETRISKFR